MFDPSDTPRVFGTPPGVDFPAQLVEGLASREDDLSDTVVYVNTTRMQRRIRTLFDAGPPRLLPQVRLITDLSAEATAAGIPLLISPLRRRLELYPLVLQLFESASDIAARTSAYDWSDSLANLLEEMHGEGVSPADIANLNVDDQSGHWQRTLAFLSILRPYFEIATDVPPDPQARLRQVATYLAEKWATEPPQHPVIVAGSTGSRGAANIFMQAVARLPQGAVLLPGFDFDTPGTVWDTMRDPLTSEDHPQFRFYRFLQALDLAPTQVQRWGGPAPDQRRNKLISLSLRPAPVTDQWRIEGPALGDLVSATAALTLIESDSPRSEAEAIALRLRQAAQDGQTAALITPDRMLTRQVTAALDRWDITPDDSAGTPLALSAPGRLLRHITDLFGREITAETVLALLKHPLVHTGADRNIHLLNTRRLELSLRRYGPPFLSGQVLADWADNHGNHHSGLRSWAAWIGAIIDDAAALRPAHLGPLLDAHIKLAQRLSAGSTGDQPGEIWDDNAGREAKAICDRLAAESDAGTLMELGDYVSLFGAVLAEGVVRDRDAGHPGILIWGTLEARVGGADLVILGGMNEGVWPEAPKPDPWLNRAMRTQAGLLLPERRIGLSAHDYQQAVAGAEVWISRAKRSADAETVPSRWINRLTNLMEGLPAQNGKEAIAAMRGRGAIWMAQAVALGRAEKTVEKAKRPSPRPPVASRPDTLSVTQIKTLIRDPYAIYARKLLRLSKLDPLQPSGDAPLRGVIYHKILERFISEGPDASDPSALTRLCAIAAEELEKNCPWPTVRVQWMARLAQIAPGFLAAEAHRQAKGHLRKTEAWGEISVGETGVTLTCKADRIDTNDQDQALIYDYKTGAVPTGPQQEKFDKQLLLEAAMVTRGAFKDIGALTVAEAAFLGLNKDLKVTPAPLDKMPPDVVWEEFKALLTAWQNRTRGYSARLAMFANTDRSDFDHLSRFTEWDLGDPVAPEDLT